MIKTSGIVIGTHNKNKKEEIRKILTGMSLPLLNLEDFDDAPDIVEDGVTFEENATKKALQLAKFCNMSVIADDSGLEIDALDKRPGVYSSRYCGEDTGYEEKCLKLFEELKNVPFDKRTARFRCAIALAEPGKLHFVVEASCEGLINLEPLGCKMVSMSLRLSVCIARFLANPPIPTILDGSKTSTNFLIATYKEGGAKSP